MRKVTAILALVLLVTPSAYAENKKLNNAYRAIDQLNISASQSEIVVGIKADMREAYKLSEKSQADLLACLEREADKKAAEAPVAPAVVEETPTP